MLQKPFRGMLSLLRSGLFAFSGLCIALTSHPSMALAGDGPTEALELRFQAERAIARERAQGNAGLADAMREALPSLLQEYLVTRDGTIATDAVDTAFVQEQFKIARALEEPGVALALEVFSGPGTGYENELRNGLANLAEFHADRADRISEKALDAHERIMERQLEKMERHLTKMQELSDKFDAAFDARLSGTLLEDEPRTQAQIEAKIEQIVEKTEVKVETVVEKLVEKVESNLEKAPSLVEKTEAKIDQIVEKAQTKIDTIVSNAESKIDNLTADSTETGKKKK